MSALLGKAPFVGCIPVLDLERARTFYETTLGLTVTEESPATVVLDAGGTMVRLTAVLQLTPQSFTVAGWQVLDILAAVAQLREHAVKLTFYDGFEPDEQGIWTAPNGDRIVWFSDPDGNVLSLTQFAQGLVDDYWR